MSGLHTCTNMYDSYADCFMGDKIDSDAIFVVLVLVVVWRENTAALKKYVVGYSAYMAYQSL